MSSTGEHETTWTVRRLLDWTIQWFTQKQVEGGRLAAELLLARAMGCRKIELYTRYDEEPTEEQRATFRELVQHAGEHTPIAYLLGTREFFSLDFNVTPAVLIPRPETEALVQRVIDLCRTSPDRTWYVLDIGTGSGCIAVAIAHYAPNTQLVASDISPEALAVAQSNVELHHVEERVQLVQADGVHLPAASVPSGGFNAIVSNPPYISEAAWDELPPNIRQHEPRLALVPQGSDGLDMYRRLASESAPILMPDGLLLVEIGYDQRDAVLDIFATGGPWTFLGAHRNPTDPYDRILEFQLA